MHARLERYGPLTKIGIVLCLAGLFSTTLRGAETPAPRTPAHCPGVKNSASAVEEANTTYLRDALPVLMGRCSRCHNSQSILPNWLDYKTAYAHRREIKRRVWDSWKGEYYKQPMPAGNGEECQSITENERTTIKEWVLDGGARGVAPTEHGPKSKQQRIEIGQKLFNSVCAACHQPTGLGLPDKFPPLAGSDFLNADKNRAIRILLNGRQGEIVVNGKHFNSSMPLLPFSDDDIANALTFVYSSFGNSGKLVTPEEVKALRGLPDEDAPGQQKVIAHVPEEKSPFE